MKIFALSLAGWCIVLSVTSVVAQDKKVVEPTAEQLKAAQEGFAKVGGKYEFVLSLRTHVGIHTFEMPHLTRDDKIMLLPDVPFPFALSLQQTALNEKGSKELKKYKQLRRLNLSFCIVPAESMRHLAELPGLEELDLTSSSGQPKGMGVLNEAEFKELANVKTLKTLHLFYVHLTDDSIKHLKDLPSLTTLSITSGRARFFRGNPVSVVGALKDFKSLTTLSIESPTPEMFRELKEVKQLRTLKLDCNGPVEKIGLKELRELDQLTAIEMNIYPGTDQDLQALRGLKNLTSLKFRGLETNITDAGLKELKEHKSLATLCLTDNKVTDAGIKELKEVKSLRTLRLTCYKTTEAALADLKELPNLTTLHLSLPRISEDGIKNLKSLKQLRYLYAAVPDSGVKHLKELPALTTLVCSYGLTDKGLKELQEVPSLRYVNVFYCHGNTVFDVTSKGFDAFQAARPDCLITRDRPKELGFEREDR